MKSIESLYGKLRPRRRSPRCLLLSAVCATTLGSLAASTWCGAGILGNLLGRSDGNIAKLQYDLQDNMPVTSIAWSPDGKLIAASSTQSNEIHIWDVEHRTIQRKLIRDVIPAFNELAWSVDGRHLAACGTEGQRMIYDAKSWAPPHVIQSEHDRRCTGLAFSSDNKELAVLGEYLSVYAIDTWRPVKELDIENGWGAGLQFYAIAYVPGTHTVLIGGQDHDLVGGRKDTKGAVYFFHPADSLPSQKFAPYPKKPPSLGGDVISLTVSPDARQLVTGTQTGAGSKPTGRYVKSSVHILDIRDGTLLGAPLDGLPFSREVGLKYTSDGRYLIVAHGGFYTDHVIHLIDASTLQVADTVKVDSTLYALTVRANGPQFAAAVGGRIMIWSLPEPRQT